MYHRKSLVTAALLAVAALTPACARPGTPGGQDKAAVPAPAPQRSVDPAVWQPVGAALGVAGQVQDGGVYRINLPRRDLQISVGDVTVKPALALTSYAAFVGEPSQALVVGDLVLLEQEVNPVLSGLQAVGLQETALHRHLLGERPNVMYLHYEGRGEAAKLAAGLRQALSASATPLASPGPSQPAPAPFDSAQMDGILGYRGRDNGDVRQYSIGRAEPVSLAGTPLPASTGVATALNFQSLGGGRAAIAGDFAMLPNEVNNVLAALRSQGIAVQSTHQHMLDESPHLIYSHFFATGDALTLARALRGALDQMRNAAPPR